MILQTKEFKQACSKILSAIDNSATGVTELVELCSSNNSLYLNVTNNEYYMSVVFPLTTVEENFKATVIDNLFLKLSSILLE